MDREREGAEKTLNRTVKSGRLEKRRSSHIKRYQQKEP